MRSESSISAWHDRPTPRAAVVAERLARAICECHPLAPAHWERALLGPLREFLCRPGKRFRGGLVASSWQIAGGPAGSMPEELALCLELLHAGSLIIDDIQDGSSHRRGGAALHELVGTPLALNAGNWLYFASSTLIDELELPAEIKLRLLAELRCAIMRCHHGQGLDLSVRITAALPPEIPALVDATTELKTASLTGLAASLGAIAAGGADGVVTALAQFGSELGVALQMFDDLGSVVSPGRRHKGVEDLCGGRPTWLWAWAVQDLDPGTLAELLAAGREVEAGADAESLMDRLAQLVAPRGRQRASQTLETAYRRLSMRVPPSAALGELAAEIHRLEDSYG